MADERSSPEPDGRSSPGTVEGLSATNALSATPRLAARFRLQYETAQQSWVLLYPEGMVKLNGSAGEIMRRIDGERSLEAIVTDLEASFQATGLAPDVLDFVRIAREQQWLID